MGDIRLIGIFGNLGCYKTAFATFLIRVLSAQYKIPIVANYKIKLPNATKLDMSELVGVEYVDHVIGEDEVYALGDSRLSMSMQNIYYSYSIAQARKSVVRPDGSRGCGNFVVYTAQLQSMADIRLFELTNLYIMMEKLPNGNAYYEAITDDGDESSGEIPRSFFERESFPFYDTDEKVMPMAIRDMQVHMEKYIPEKYNRRIDDVCGLMLKKYRFGSFRDVQRFTVADFCRRCGVPDLLVVPVFDRLREMVRVGQLSKMDI